MLAFPVRASKVLVRVAAGAMGRAFHQISPTVPFGGLGGVWLEFAGFKEHPVPERDREAPVQREGQLVLRLLLFHAWEGRQVVVNGINLVPRHFGKMRVGKSRIEFRTIARDTLMHGPPELIF